MKPLLAHVYEPHRVSYPCFVQPKLNGVRALYQNGRFQSRDEQPFPARLLAHLAEPLQKVFGPEVILDGELYVHGWPLQRINSAVTPVRQEDKEDTKLVQYHVFDVVDYNTSFAKRQLTRMLIDEGLIRSVATVVVENETQANKCYVDWVFLGYEGMMYRLGDCPYTMPKQPFYEHPLGCGRFGPNKSRALSDRKNRCWHLLKRKSWQDEDFVITGVVEGEGKYAGMLGALECCIAVPEISATFTVGSGLTDADRQKYWEFPMLAIGHRAKVKFLCLSEAGIPLNPTLLAIL